jgi:cystathionine gamma-synthase
MDHTNAKPETIAAQALGWIDEKTRAITPPIHVSSTYLRDEDNQYRSGRVYARADNPAFDQAEAVITQLEQGAASLLFASGMAAATAVFQALAPGDHVLAPKVMYWSLRNWLLNFATHWGLQVELVDMTDPAAVQAAIRPGKTRLVWIETPANPLWTVTDIAATAAIAHAAGAVLAVDSTVASPVLTRPLDLGADIVMHAATKYLNGHSDLIAGVLVTRADNALWQRIRSVRAQLGGTLGSFEAWLLLRGMRTVYLRVRAASASAQQMAEHFHGHGLVARCCTPGCRGAGPCGGRAPDGGRIRRHVVDPRGRRRSGGDRHRRQGGAVETRHLARRHRKPDRAPGQRRRRRLAGADRPAAPVGRHRTCPGSDRRPGAGVAPGASGDRRLSWADRAGHRRLAQGLAPGHGFGGAHADKITLRQERCARPLHGREWLSRSGCGAPLGNRLIPCMCQEKDGTSRRIGSNLAWPTSQRLAVFLFFCLITT